VCTVALRISRGDVSQLSMVAVRDEFYSRPTLPPAAHWPERDLALIGPLDLQRGGAPLAVHIRRGVAAVVVNAPPHTVSAPEGSTARTRGMLPLQAAAGMRICQETVTDLPGFHLLIAASPNAADPSAQLISWDGTELTHHIITTGDHVLTSAGLDVAGQERSERVQAVLARAPSDAAVDSAHWQEVAVAAVVEDQDLSAGRYGTVGAAAITLSSGAVRYWTCGRPGDAPWLPVVVNEPALTDDNRSERLVAT
jgi:hypothetical protein